MVGWLLAVAALANSGATADTGVGSGTGGTGSNDTASISTGETGVASTADTGAGATGGTGGPGTGETGDGSPPTGDTGPAEVLTAAALAGETGGVGCSTVAPFGAAAWPLLLLVARRRS
jgi:hypothetical protein